jgi:hypothetical protein
VAPLALTCCALLIPIAARPPLPVTLLILAASGACASFQVAANATFVAAARLLTLGRRSQKAMASCRRRRDVTDPLGREGLATVVVIAPIWSSGAGGGWPRRRCVVRAVISDGGGG